VRSVEIVALDARAKPPSMVIQLRVSGRRYVEDRTTTTVLSGDKSVETSFTQHWRMELTDDDARPWRIAAVETRSARDKAVEVEPAGPS
jgi:predicted lipid-binding transport protein (Tim44 family)